MDFQDNKVCIWSLAENVAHEAVTSTDTTAPPTGDPQLLCSANHVGDVTDLKVSSL